MPILAGIPVVEGPVIRPPDPFLDTRTLAFESLDGSYVMESTGRERFFRAGIEGLELPPREVVRQPIPGMEGSRLQEIRIGEREIFLPLFIASPISHLDQLGRMDEIAALLNHRNVNYTVEDGTLNLVANSARGERRLRVVYLSGWESAKGSENAGREWTSVGLRMLAVRPYWYGDRWTTPEVQVASGASFFGNFPPLLSSSFATGAGMPVAVAGDAPSWPRVDLIGPATSVTITGPGLSVSIPAGLAAAEVAYIETDPRSRSAVFAGTKNWARVAPTDHYSALKPGVNTINITIAGATSATRASVSGPTLYERPW